MLGDFDFSVLGDSLPFLWTGLLFTVKLTLIAMTGGVILGTLLALAAGWAAHAQDAPGLYLTALLALAVKGVLSSGMISCRISELISRYRLSIKSFLR